MRDYNTIFDQLKEGILICDKQCKVIYFNKSYEKFINIKLDKALGKDIKEIRPGAKLPQVIKSGEPLLGIVRKESDQEEYIVNVYPMFNEKEIEGAISVVTYLKDAQIFNNILLELENNNKMLENRLISSNGTRYNFKDIIAISPVSKSTIELAKKVSTINIDVLLQGESGTGKELYAQSIHNYSNRRYNNFVAINCSALPKDILEAELFGYEEGSFTGAVEGGKIGLFESANQGTIFLDEISEMDLELQTKLLRVIQERSVRRIGSDEEIPLDIRIISACNVDLGEYIEKGKFREDLYYRIAVVPIKIEPLRNRTEDINPLIDDTLKNINLRLKKNIKLEDDVREVLNKYSWPGNIRELKNILEFSSVMSTDEVIDIYCLPNQLLEENNPDESQMTLKERVEEFERLEISKMIKKYNNSVEGKERVADILNISLATLYNKLKVSKK